MNVEPLPNPCPEHEPMNSAALPKDGNGIVKRRKDYHMPQRHEEQFDQNLLGY